MKKDEPHTFKRLVPGHPYCVDGLRPWESGISCGRLEHDPIHQAGRAVRMDINDCTHGDGCTGHPDTHAVHNFDADALEHGYQREIESLTARMAAALVQLKRLRAEVSVVTVVRGHDDRSRFRESVDKIAKTLTLPAVTVTPAEVEPIDIMDDPRCGCGGMFGMPSDHPKGSPGCRYRPATPAEVRTGISDRAAAALTAVADLRREVGRCVNNGAMGRGYRSHLDVIEQALRAGGAA